MASGAAKFFTVILVLILIGGGVFVGWFWANDWMFDKSPTTITPVIDGVIEEKEWMRSSYYNIPFYLDVDNDLDPVENKSNVDGWNYLSVAEDEDYYYVAVDLCSDRTNNKEGEWVTFQLANRLPDTEGSKMAFSALEDFGYEYLFYNVSDDSVFEHEYIPIMGFTDYYFDIPIIPETDLLEVYRGNATWEYEDFWTDYDDKNFTATSRFYDAESIWLNGSFLDLHFGVNITEKFPDEEISTFMASIFDMYVELRFISNLTADAMGHYGIPDEFFFAVDQHGGMPGNVSDWTYVSAETSYDFSADIYSIVYASLNPLNINASTGMFYFSLRGWNDPDGYNFNPFEIEFDKISLILATEEIGTVLGNTIETGNYDIAYSFGPSVNCIEDHRMFEFKIAKAEFPVLDDEFLYLYMGGYGTMAIENSNFWVYPKYGFPESPIYSSVDEYYDFLKFDMSLT